MSVRPSRPSPGSFPLPRPSGPLIRLGSRFTQQRLRRWSRAAHERVARIEANRMRLMRPAGSPVQTAYLAL